MYIITKIVMPYHLVCRSLVGGLGDGRTGEALLGTTEAFATTLTVV